MGVDYWLVVLPSFLLLVFVENRQERIRRSQHRSQHRRPSYRPTQIATPLQDFASHQTRHPKQDPFLMTTCQDQGRHHKSTKMLNAKKGHPRAQGVVARNPNDERRLSTYGDEEC